MSPPTIPLLEFCGEVVPVARIPFTIGRDADLIVDDANRHLHRRLLAVERRRGLYVLANIGTRLSVSVGAPDGCVESQLAPGGVLALVLGQHVVRFAAGPTTYELALHIPSAPFAPEPPRPADAGADATVRRTPLSPDQLAVLTVLAEPVLRGGKWAAAALPSNRAAADRLGWTLTKYNRKLDNLCAKFEARGVRGLHGASDRLANNRRARLVEYAISAGLVTRADLSVLP